MKLGRLLGATIAIASLLAACGGAGSGVASSTTAPLAAASAQATPYVPPAPQSTNDASGYGDYYGYGTPAPKASSPSGPLQLVTSAKLGTLLAASNGMTLYTNKNDTAKSSACNDACASIWPPLLTTAGAPAGPAGATGKVGTVTWSDGSMQVTYNGQPLYLYQGDFKSGDANGDGIDGIWVAVRN